MEQLIAVLAVLLAGVVGLRMLRYDGEPADDDPVPEHASGRHLGGAGHQ